MVILLKIEIINVWYYKTTNIEECKTSNDRNTVVSFSCLKYDINVIVVITAQFDPGTYSVLSTDHNCYSMCICTGWLLDGIIKK